MGTRRRSGRDLPEGVWIALAVVGLCTLGFGVWQLVRGPAPTPATETTAFGGGVAEGGGPPSASGIPDKALTGPVSPGTVSLDLAAPEARSVPGAGALCPGCDIVLITVCSLRKDHVGVYGTHPGLTPGIDSVADGGFRFDRAYSASNFTLASLTAVLTGRFGSSTGVLGWDKGLVADVPVLPEILGYYGYRTGAFTVDAPSGFRPDYGLHRGFQRMAVVPSPRDTPDGRFQPGPVGPGGASADAVVDWLAHQPTDRPLFASFHTRSAHFPFVNSDAGAAEDATGITQLLWDAGRIKANAAGAMPGMAGGTAQQGVVQIVGPDPLQVQVDRVGAPAVAMWRQRYAEAVARMDLDVRRVLDAVARRGRAERTIIVVVADHGESILDHGELLHGDAYFDGVVNVPLVMKVPGLKGGGEGALVSHVDLLPTLLELVGAVPPAGIDGVSLVPLLRGKVDRVRDIALVEGGVARQTQSQPRGAVVALPWTLLQQDRGCGGRPADDPPRRPGEPATCLYDVAADPAQDHNVAAAHPTVVRELLTRWSDFRAARGTEGATLALDPAFVETLRTSGYDFSGKP